MTPRVLVRVPASSANLGPGFDCLAIALALHLELEVLECGALRRRERSAGAVRRAQSLRARVRAARACRGTALPHQLADPARGRPRLERRRDRGRHAGCRGAPPRRARTCSRRRPPSRVIRTTSPRPCTAASSCAPTAAPSAARCRRASRPSSWCPRSPSRPAPRGPCCPATVALSDAVFNVAHASLVTLGLARGDREMLAQGLQDRLHEAGAQRPLPALLRARPSGVPARGDRREHLGRRPERPRLVRQRGLRSRSRSGSATRSRSWANVRTVPFEARGAHAVADRRAGD